MIANVKQIFECIDEPFFYFLNTQFFWVYVCVCVHEKHDKKKVVFVVF